MPTYTYRCKNGHQFDVLLTFAEGDRKKTLRCKECQAMAARTLATGLLDINSSKTPQKAIGKDRKRFTNW